MLAQDARARVDREPTLRMEQRARYLDGAERRLELLLEYAAKTVRLAELDVRLTHQHLGRHTDAQRQFVERLRNDQRALLLGIPEILELPRDACDARIENVERHAIRLAQHLCRRFRVAERFIVKPPALAVHLKAPLCDCRPSNENVVWARDRAVPLITAERIRPRAERLAPQHCITLVARV